MTSEFWLDVGTVTFTHSLDKWKVAAFLPETLVPFGVTWGKASGVNVPKHESSYLLMCSKSFGYGFYILFKNMLLICLHFCEGEPCVCCAWRSSHFRLPRKTKELEESSGWWKHKLRQTTIQLQPSVSMRPNTSAGVYFSILIQHWISFCKTEDSTLRPLRCHRYASQFSSQNQYWSLDSGSLIIHVFAAMLAVTAVTAYNRRVYKKWT